MTTRGDTTFPAHLVRPDLRDFAGYSSARTSAPTGIPDRIWLNANESGVASPADSGGVSRRYPDPQPAALVEAFADLWATTPDRVVVGRGSDEAIELLVRSLCRPGGDGVVVTSPTFGMYTVSARLHGVPVTDVPQTDDGLRWRVDTAAVARAAREHGARLVFVASPGNPTGSVVPLREIAALAEELADQAVVVVDEAYGEFAQQRSAITLLEEHPTLVVLRTLSKAHALAGARVGIALAHPDLVVVLRRVQAPYPLPAPVTELALRALSEDVLHATAQHVGEVLRLRDQVGRWLRDLDDVRTVYASEANFFLVRCDDPDALLHTLGAAGIVVRDMRHLPGLHDALRITIGTGPEMAALREALTASSSPTTSTDISTDTSTEESPA
ncbi:histidinol-phosphate aminotransferase [Serinicoccus chungangensis]|uniref:Histidinol-phosphate aminotransferase n=1 Tax=Serinicoccus chungangensis TaxID=767452 RepID=A0A0W8I769_9MICO|nr:histidinol-phosphate transaminase [Serinicoccus chungangensis]KUG54443.1 histidinol-phosphate aminotransferase [Serinicoccus chungangensis]